MGVSYCVIENNTGSNGGGVFFINNSHNPTDDYFGIYECKIRGNEAFRGGGIYAHNVPLKITNSSIKGNQASGSGGALYISNCTPQIENTLICGNYPDQFNAWYGGIDDLGGNTISEFCDTDCNFNDIDDLDETTNGTVQDCNGNIFPDECDISYGNSTDFNENEIPDECECISDTNNDNTVDVLDL